MYVFHLCMTHQLVFVYYFSVAKHVFFVAVIATKFSCLRVTILPLCLVSILFFSLPFFFFFFF